MSNEEILEPTPDDEPTTAEQWAAYEEYVEALNNELRAEGALEYRLDLARLINAELSWNTQDENFRKGLQWVLDKLENEPVL